MSEEILKALMQLFAIITKQDEGVTANEKEYVISFLKSQLNEEQVIAYNKLYEAFYVGKDEKSEERKRKRAAKETKPSVSLDDLKNDPLLSKADDELSEEDLKAKNRLLRKIRREEAKAKDAAAASENEGSKSPAEALEELKNDPILAIDDVELSEEDQKKKAKLQRKIRREEAKLKESEKASGEENDDSNLTSVKDSVRTLSICKKINKTLSQPQKIVVLVRLFELLKSDGQFSTQRMAIIDTVSEVFNFDEEEFKAVQSFVVSESIKECNSPNILIANNTEVLDEDLCKHINTENLNGDLMILKVNSVDLYFMRYLGDADLNFNGLTVDAKRIYLFAPGSTIRLPKDKPIYYSDVVARFLSDTNITKLSVDVSGLWFQFPNGNVGLRDVNLSEEHGKLVGIMGASGAGKTTLLNVLCGIESPSEGSVKINGIDIHSEPEKVEGVIGYIPQDDLLLEDLTVYQNLFYNAKLCFATKSDEEIDEMVLTTLNNLGLLATKDLKVGNPLQKTISGGQRKRLNIGLELIREPSVLFVDEPTSGLSSRDSENVMDLLRELTLKGKSIYVVIHQPSSDIYKMFDKIFILDTGGYPIYYGNPVEAVMYFKRIDAQVNADQGECMTCGNVDVEQIFNIIEANVVDEYGRFTGVRKVAPEKWSEFYKENITIEPVEEIEEEPDGSLDLPSKFKQWIIFTTRDVLSKLANKQYLIINLIEAPLLALILAFIIRYVDNDGGAYVYGKNENIPAFLFICIIVALFMGLTVSAEEIVKDQRILKRESFLNLSKGGYFVSKMGILFTVSAVQTFTFVLIGNAILGVTEMLFQSWFILFTVSCFANMLGLNISASFNSAITIYILIPILLIPQMVLSGAIFSFDKLNEWIGSDDDVPVIADMMVSRWAFEAMAVNQFTQNNFQKVFYDQERKESKSDFKQVYYIPKLEDKLDYVMQFTAAGNAEQISNGKAHLASLKEYIEEYNDQFEDPYEDVDDLNYDEVLVSDFSKIRTHLSKHLNEIDSREKTILYSKLYRALDSCTTYILFENERERKKVIDNLELLRTEIEKENNDLKIYQFEKLDQLNIDSLHWGVITELDEHLADVKKEYGRRFADANGALSDMRFILQDGTENKKRYRRVRDKYHNSELAMLVKKTASKKRIKEKNNQLIQVVDPIYRLPSKDQFFLDYRTHFFSPKKRLFGMSFDTYYFNILVIWTMSILLFVTLYFGLLKEGLERVGAITSRIVEQYIQPKLEELTVMLQDKFGGKTSIEKEIIKAQSGEDE